MISGCQAPERATCSVHRERLAGWTLHTELQEHWPPPRSQPEEGGLADGKDTHGPAGLGASLPGSKEKRKEQGNSAEKTRCFQKESTVLKAGFLSSPGLNRKWVGAEGWLSGFLLFQWEAQSLGRKLPDTLQSLQGRTESPSCPSLTRTLSSCLPPEREHPARSPVPSLSWEVQLSQHKHRATGEA